MILTNRGQERYINSSDLEKECQGHSHQQQIDSTTSTVRVLKQLTINPDPDAEVTSPEAVYQASADYVAAGLSVIPIDAELSTKGPEGYLLPKGSWKVYQVRRPRPDELDRWYDRGRRYGLAVVAGVVSGGVLRHGLEILDFDTAELGPPWIQRVETRAPGLIERLVRIQSPRPGSHFYYRCREFGNSQKLACEAERDEAGKPILESNGRAKIRTRIELKGEGGYCIVPPSPPRCHPSNRLYTLVPGSAGLCEIPIIEPEERAILLEEARRFNQCKEPQRTRHLRLSSNNTDSHSPANDFNRRADWSNVLCPHGWEKVGGNGSVEYW